MPEMDRRIEPFKDGAKTTVETIWNKEELQKELERLKEQRKHGEMFNAQLSPIKKTEAFERWHKNYKTREKMKWQERFGTNIDQERKRSAENLQTINKNIAEIEKILK